MIEVKNIYKSYGNLHVLQDISFEIKQGEIVAVTGASGAGKTTLLNIIGTLDKADKGQVIINNRNITTRSCRFSETRRLDLCFNSTICSTNLRLWKTPLCPQCCTKAIKKKRHKKQWNYWTCCPLRINAIIFRPNFRAGNNNV